MNRKVLFSPLTTDFRPRNEVHEALCHREGKCGGRGFLELLQDQFLLPVVVELVGAEKVAVVERR